MERLDDGRKQNGIAGMEGRAIVLINRESYRIMLGLQIMPSEPSGVEIVRITAKTADQATEKDV